LVAVNKAKGNWPTHQDKGNSTVYIWIKKGKKGKQNVHVGGKPII